MVASLRESYRAHLRKSALEAAYAETVEKGWDKVRVGQIAASIGAPRAMLYKEFGDKRGLGEALVLGEAERFLAGIEGVLQEHSTDPAGGIQAAVHYTLAEAEGSPLLRAVLVSHRDPAIEREPSPVMGKGMLPLMTTSGRLLDLASETLADWLRQQFPQLDVVDVQNATDALVRLAVSHLALPGADAAVTGQQISEVALRYLGLQRSVARQD
jgi:AcrR family transcriptional regulator